MRDRPATVLVIEDNALNLKLVRLILQRDGHRVLSASNAGDGISLAREHLPQAILMDIQLPGVDGISASRQLKEDPLTAAIPIMVLTAHAMKGDDARALEAGCDAYLTKPFRLAEFRSTLQALIGTAS